MVVTTHDMEEAEKLSDRVCIIDHGRVLALDTVEDVKDAAASTGTGDKAAPGDSLEDVSSGLMGKGAPRMRALAFLEKTFLENLRQWKILSLSRSSSRPASCLLMLADSHVNPSSAMRCWSAHVTPQGHGAW